MAEWVLRQTGWASLHARIRHLTKRADADDLLQTALLHLLERGQGDVANTEAYILRAARNLAIDRFRREQRSNLVSLLPEHIENVASHAPLPDAVMLGREQLVQLGHAFQELDARTAGIFVLHRINNLSYRAIAKRYDVSVSTVEKSISKALCVLTSALLATGKA